MDIKKQIKNETNKKMTIKDWLKNFYEDLTESELQEAENRMVEFYAFLAKKLSENKEILQPKN